MSGSKMKELRRKVYGKDVAYYQTKRLRSTETGQIINMHRISYRKAKNALKNK